MRPKHILVGFVTLVARVRARRWRQDAPAGLADAGRRPSRPTGRRTPATRRPCPRATAYYVVVRGDTLWDIAGALPEEPVSVAADLGRQQVHQGRALDLPRRSRPAPEARRRRRAGRPGASPTGPEGEAPAEAGAGGAGKAAGERRRRCRDALTPVTEELSLQCADYVVRDREDESLHPGRLRAGLRTRIALADRDIVYLNKGSNVGRQGRRPLLAAPRGLRRAATRYTGKKLGTKIDTTGWVKVILVQENVATAVDRAGLHRHHARRLPEAVREGERADDRPARPPPTV